ALTDHARLCQGVTGTVEDLSERVQRKLYYMLTTGTVTVSATADADAIAGLAIQEGIAMSYSGDGVKFGLQMSAQGQLVTDVDIAAGVDITWSPGTQLPTTLELDDMIEVYASIGVGVGPELLVESEFGVDIIFAIPTTSEPITVEWLMSRFSGISVTASVAASALPLQGSGTVAAGVQMSVPFTPTEAERIPPPPGELYPGLKAYGGDYAGPTVSQQGDVVTLGGLVKRTESSWPEALFILPEDRRPTKRLVFPANQHDGRARIDILPDGRVLVVSTGSRDYVSLDGISFRKTAGTAMPLGPSVNPYGGDYEGPSMSVVGDIVRLQGLAKRTNNDWSVIGTLPAGYRPARRIAFEALSHNHDIRVDIKPDGQVIWNTGNESSPWISLSGIELVKTGVGTETTSTRRPFPVGPGVEAYTHAEYRSPQIEKSGGVVRLSGFVKRTGSTWPKIGTLPAGYRPSARRIFHLNTNDGFARVDVLPNGDVLVVHGGTAYPMIALSGIRFEAN
ncbi:MAG: hypothetical protein KC656_26890, partial [Myxococcales bacterium]|nr:hypothetical protein [Myxococcales bacterium]